MVAFIYLFIYSEYSHSEYKKNKVQEE